MSEVDWIYRLFGKGFLGCHPLTTSMLTDQLAEPLRLIYEYMKLVRSTLISAIGRKELSWMSLLTASTSIGQVVDSLQLI